ncbi:RNA polymerase, sigma-24 subunit, ECF subfamily [Chloroherpeton thalassium ATCC 35110]|uniref:RNA polymerase, sigma-24 subunit, ECF subfamily n=1 Tax=Chloroherpeton thalassium (strain ATCC 35110 / GB-78) TaxID=517418 RepID=B3QXS5_CHLT3|nr:sigma factor-like helix-turn-helix DNA-binding protein [Chloroherpeton thalassium]ACF14990.1 RNA polymerase, sigma-24 subunit, ECF subfamily [Chloroherpeton thalassium ATCC 35110]
MNTHQKAAMEFIDDVYNLAYWMTGNEASTGMLVSQVYLNTPGQTSAEDLFKLFRKHYLNAFGQSTAFNASDVMFIEDGDVAKAVLNLPSDFKLVVLLSDVLELTHTEISHIIEKPIDTVRSWIHWGRKLLGKEIAERASAN